MLIADRVETEALVQLAVCMGKYLLSLQKLAGDSLYETEWQIGNPRLQLKL